SAIADRTCPALGAAPPAVPLVWKRRSTAFPFAMRSETTSTSRRPDAVGPSRRATFSASFNVTGGWSETATARAATTCFGALLPRVRTTVTAATASATATRATRTLRIEGRGYRNGNGDRSPPEDGRRNTITDYREFPRLPATDQEGFRSPSSPAITASTSVSTA